MEEPDGRMDGSSVAVVQSDVCCQGKTQSRPPNDEGVTRDDFDSIVGIRGFSYKKVHFKRPKVLVIVRVWDVSQ